MEQADLAALICADPNCNVACVDLLTMQAELNGHRKQLCIGCMGVYDQVHHCVCTTRVTTQKIWHELQKTGAWLTETDVSSFTRPFVLRLHQIATKYSTTLGWCDTCLDITRSQIREQLQLVVSAGHTDMLTLTPQQRATPIIWGYVNPNFPLCWKIDRSLPSITLEFIRSNQFISSDSIRCFYCINKV